MILCGFCNTLAPPRFCYFLPILNNMAYILTHIVPLDIWVGVCCVRSCDLFELSLSDHWYLILCDGGLSPGSCCEITVLDWDPYIQEDCTCWTNRNLVYLLVLSFERKTSSWKCLGFVLRKPWEDVMTQYSLQMSIICDKEFFLEIQAGGHLVKI